MERLTRVVLAAFVGTGGVLLAALPLEAQSTRISAFTGMQARATSGTISGTVMDERGGALTGAMVSALGVTMASTVTDDRGQFTFTQLPPGDYLLRAHMIGFAASGGAMVRVGVSPSVYRFQLRRLDVPSAAVGTSGTVEAPVEARPIIAAGFDLPRGAGTEAESGSSDADHPHTETAWRLRHLKRSILKDASSIVVLTDDDPALPTTGTLFGRAMGSAANLASSLFTDFPFSGEVNFLTTSAPGALFSGTAPPRGVAYLALAAPGAGGDWSIRAAMSEGDLSSWLVAGAFASKPGGTHTYDFGLSYSTQEYTGGNPAALAAVTDGNRNVGELYAFDRWSLRPSVAFEYGARYAHYDYLEDRGLLSPRLGVSVEAFDRTRVRGSVAQRMVAPGAEEFLSTNTPGPWLPPERTFAPLIGPRDVDSFRVERARSYDVSVEREVGDAFVIGVGRFHQSVDDQLVTLFGLQMPGGPKSVGHYYVGSVGAVEADGWAVRFDTPASSRIKGSVHYSMTRARWLDRGDVQALMPVAPAAVRPDLEDLHDLTSSLAADFAQTATRVFVLYKLNSGFVRSNTALNRPGLDGRFDVQVNQALPVTIAGTRWEVLVGLRNLFRDPTDPASVYDELLVVRPPKRLVGGFLVRF
jgi:Carboxypeptidase regulatory-like domain/TonB dependent receptor-like, beta-barrel